MWLLAPNGMLEPQIESAENKDNADICYQPRPKEVPEEQDVYTDHDDY
jgi:hypothetical protein